MDFSLEIHNLHSKLKKKEKTLVIADGDPDGISSAYVISKMLINLDYVYKVDFDVWIVSANFRNLVSKDSDTVQKINSYKNIIFLDYSLNNYEQFRESYICVIDHHKNFLEVDCLINPSINSDINPSSSAISYYVYKNIIGKDDIVRDVALLGAIGDWMVNSSIDYLDIKIDDENYFVRNQLIPPTYKFMRIFSLLPSENIENLEIFEYMLYNIYENLIPMLSLPKNMDDEIINLEIQKNECIRNAIKRVENVGQFTFLELDEKESRFGHDFSEILKITSKNKTLIVRMHTKNVDYYRLSLRSKDLNLIDLINDIKLEFEVKGGGHPFAAGLAIYCKDYLGIKKYITNYKNK